MPEKIRLVMTELGLCVQFMTVSVKHDFITAMNQHGLDMFKNEMGYLCSIKPYTEDYLFGYFLSRENRVGIVFPSEKLKYFFKEYIHLKGDAFMDMGPGYEAQMHLNPDLLIRDV